MESALLDALDDLERAGDAPPIVTLTGSPGERLTQLTKAAGLIEPSRDPRFPGA